MQIDVYFHKRINFVAGRLWTPLESWIPVKYPWNCYCAVRAIHSEP